MPMKMMEYDAIMKEITSGLVGEPEADLAYLNEQSEKYKDHELALEISRGIGRLMFELIPEELREKFDQFSGNQVKGLELVLDEAEFQMQRKEFGKARSILEAAVARVEADADWFRDDGVSEYHHFANMLEEILHQEYFKPEKTVRRLPEDYARLYFVYGIVLVELGFLAEARVALEKALRVNPVKTDILFELGETYKLEGDYDRFLLLSRQCLKYAYTRAALGRCYRNLGYYYIEKQDYRLASALFFFSLAFDQEGKTAQSELFYISQLTGEEVRPPSLEELRGLLEGAEVPMGADDVVLEIGLSIGRYAEDQGALEPACFFYGIVYELTGDEEIGERIELLSGGDGPVC